MVALLFCGRADDLVYVLPPNVVLCRASEMRSRGFGGGNCPKENLQADCEPTYWDRRRPRLLRQTQVTCNRSGRRGRPRSQ